MPRWLRVFACLGAVLALAQASRAADWKTIKPQRTAETEFIGQFGAPDEIVATFPWSEWSARWKIRPRTTSYVLRYRSDPPKSEILLGAGGRADSVEVFVADSMVITVTWNYSGPSARAAAVALRADPEMRFDAAEPPCYGSKAAPNGRLFVELGPSNSPVRVVYDLK